MALVRLQKWLSSAGVCSRRHGETLITSGKVRVNGRIVDVLGTRIDPSKDKVEVDGVMVREKNEKIYLALHKPKGYVTSCSHPGEKIVLDLIDLPQRIYPIGRLDKDSTGLLLLTNDGRLHHRLSHPSFNHEKEYSVEVDRALEDSDLKRLAGGISIFGSKTRPAKVRRFSSRRFRIILKQGRNRQIRRMVKKLGYRVRKLKRIRLDQIKLGDLAPGAWRYLTTRERKLLLRGVENTNGRQHS
ncbi:MAG: rRNA pseudouridine synthase [Desulfobacteraceae bacterium]|nr:rRNA pseudouridine synthase [Desulfobacteraceae bacterium]